MKYCLFIFLCFLESTSVFAVVNHKISYKEKNFCDTIEISYEDNHIIVPVIVNNHKYRFMFDTGASLCIFNDSIGDLSKEEKDSVEVGDIHKTRKKAEHGTMQDFYLGKNCYSDFDYVVGHFGVTLNYDGILGAYDLIRNGISAKIDIRNGIMILTDKKGMFKNEQGIRIPYKDFLNCQFSMSYGCSGNARFDTGANLFMKVDKSKYFDNSANGKDKDKFKRQVRWRDYGSSDYGVHGLGSACETIYMQLDEVKMGDVVFMNMPVDSESGNTVIGCRTLEYGSVIIDSDKKMLKYQPYDSENNVYIKEKVKDVSCSMNEGHIVVSMINTDSDVYRQGLRKGHTLVEFNNYPINNIHDYYKAHGTTDQNKIYTTKYRDENGNIIEIVFNR